MKLVVCFLLTLAALSAGTGCSHRASDLGYDTRATELTSDERDLLHLINDLRKENGVEPLTVESPLQIAAKHHSEYQYRSLELGHSEPAPNETSDDRIANAGGEYAVTGENCACGFPDARSTFEMWAKDRAHREAMLSPSYQFAGISQQGDGGTITSECASFYWTLDLGGK